MASMKLFHNGDWQYYSKLENEKRFIAPPLFFSTYNLQYVYIILPFPSMHSNEVFEGYSVISKN